MARRLISSQRKLRGVARRLRALHCWAESWRDSFPSESELDPADRYWNIKIPVDLNLVESRWTTDEIRKECAQALVNAAGHLAKAKPEWAMQYRVTAALNVSSLFSSEICIYLDESYFSEHTSLEQPGRSPVERSITEDWSLQLPTGFKEIGLAELQVWGDGQIVREELWWLAEAKGHA